MFTPGADADADGVPAINPAELLCEFALDTFKHVNEFAKVAAKQQREKTPLNKSAFDVALASLIQIEMRIRTAKVRE